MSKIKSEMAAGQMSVGIPRALLYYRYRVLWETFFESLHVKIILSPETDRSILEEGSARAVDEMCLSVKIFMGHVNRLIGTCDYIFIPQIANFGLFRELCTTFTALYDVSRNIFRKEDQKFLTCRIDGRYGQDEEEAFTALGESLGFSRREAKKAYKTAKKAESEDWKSRIRAQERLSREAGIRIMVTAHPYVIEDPYFGKPLLTILEGMGVLVLRSDITNREDALKKAKKFSPTMKWEYSREITGGLLAWPDVDGIIFVSAFPCGPDSMVTEMYMRKKKEVPVLNLVLDAQSGTAGMETRLESFVDILKRRKAAV